MHRIHAAAHAHGSSVHSLLLAAFALAIADMAIDFRWPTQKLKVTSFDYACGLKNFPNVSIAIFDGLLIANTAYTEELIDPATMRTISENAVKRLISACQ
jgi:hypothetical protein